MTQLTPELVDAFRRLDTCSVSNAVETFDCRLRNEGFTDSAIRCLFERLPPVVGHAVTARIRCSAPPAVGHTYYDRTDWWNYILTLPPPRIVVVEDTDEHPGVGALVGEVHANILHALGCVAYVTTGLFAICHECTTSAFNSLPHTSPCPTPMYTWSTSASRSRSVACASPPATCSTEIVTAC